MEAAFNEMSLALFTTLAPMGAGAFVLLAVAFATGGLDAERLRSIDKATAIPLVFVIAGFASSFFHLANPAGSLGVLSQVGTSPLSNEVAFGVAFVVLAAAYWVWALTGTMPAGARRGFSIVVAVAGALFSLSVGAAYLIDTIPSWNTLAVPAQTLGFSLVGGAALGMLTLAAAGCRGLLSRGAVKSGVAAMLAAGLVLGIGGLVAQLVMTSGMQNAMQSGSELVANATALIVCGAVCLAATGACDAFVVRRGRSAGAVLGASVGAAVLAVAGILALRLVFYAIQLSAGLAAI